MLGVKGPCESVCDVNSQEFEVINYVNRLPIDVNGVVDITGLPKLDNDFFGLMLSEMWTQTANRNAL